MDVLARLARRRAFFLAELFIARALSSYRAAPYRAAPYRAAPYRAAALELVVAASVLRLRKSAPLAATSYSASRPGPPAGQGWRLAGEQLLGHGSESTDYRRPSDRGSGASGFNSIESKP